MISNLNQWTMDSSLTDLRELKEILASATPEPTFFGKRVVYYQNEKVALSTLQNKI